MTYEHCCMLVLPSSSCSSAALQDWQQEYTAVLAGWQLLEDSRAELVQRHEGIGLAVVRPPKPLHYYCTFSFAIGCDTVLTVLPGSRYELESRCAE